MSILANLEKAEAILKNGEALINGIKAESRAAVNPKTFIQENTNKIVGKVRKDLAENATERSKILLSNCFKAQSKLEAYTKPSRTGLETLHFMTAERITRASSLEDALASYKRQVSRLSASELKDLRYVYDGALFEAVAIFEPAAEFRADQAIDAFRSDTEKAYREDVKLEVEVFQQLKEIDALIESQVAELEAGEKPVHYSWAQVLNEARENARLNIQVASPMPELKVNPYDSESEESAAPAGGGS